MFLGGILQDLAIGLICFIDVRDGGDWQGFSCIVDICNKVGPVGLVEVPPPDRFSLCQLDDQWCTVQGVALAR